MPDVTTNEVGEPTAKVQPKVAAGALGTGLSGAVATIGVYVFETLSGHDLPGTIEAAIVVVIATVCGFVAGYIKKPSPSAS